jgi:hypothetical protein
MQPLEPVPVTVYVVLTVGVATTLEHVEHERLADGDQTYVVAPDADRVAVVPGHILVPPETTSDGSALTVIVEIVLHPVGIEYVIREVPAATADNKPVADPTVATPVVLLLQVPPAGLLLNELVLPAHIVVDPEMEVGVGLTVTVTVALFVHPFEPVPTTVYVVVIVGEAVGDAQVVHDNPIEGDHE